MLSDEEIQKRRPIWAALSGLWLDTELSDTDLQRIAKVLAESEFSLEDLRGMYTVEVAPVLAVNLWSVAGEWEGFDAEWLSSRIVSNLRNRPRRTRFWAQFPLTRHWMTYATEGHWKRITGIIQELRSGKSHSPSPDANTR